jgi:hypothetical protein
MPSRNTSIAAKCLLACGASVLSTMAMASLKDKPPKGVALSGLWQIDPYRSDDANAVLGKVRSDMQEKSYSRAGGGRRGGYGGGGGFPGGGGGFPGGGGGFPGGGGYGHGGHHRSHDSSDSSGSSDDVNGSRPGRNQMLADLINNPNTLDFSSTEHNTLKVSAEQTNVECAAGVKVAISDGGGSAERNCGWDGRAWVVETDRGKDLKRTDRYELSKDGKTLTYTTTASGTRVPKIKITRTYTAAF